MMLRWGDEQKPGTVQKVRGRGVLALGPQIFRGVGGTREAKSGPAGGTPGKDLNVRGKLGRG